tara:strand:+ start:110 stop:949 length:840 start_codon:yes stop_codon:yes gene_type:complete
MKIFLTGASGFLGKNLIKEAIKKGHFIYAPSRKKKNTKYKNVKWLFGSFNDNWKAQLRDSDVLVHLAAAGVNNKTISFNDAFKVNVTMSLKLLLNALRFKCNNWVIVGSSSEYGKSAIKKKKLTIYSKILPETNYEVTKAIFSFLSFNLAKKNKCNYRLMRLFPTYGPGESKKRLWSSLRKASRSKKKFYMTKGDQVWDFIHVKQAAISILQAAESIKSQKKFQQIWHIASGQPTTIKAFAQKIWKKNGSQGRLMFGKLKKRDNKNYISDKKFIWNFGK